MPHTLTPRTHAKPGILTRATTRMRLPAQILALTATITLGCNSKPAAPPTTQHAEQQPQYPARPTVPAPPFRVFHQTSDSLTLTTDPNATDDGIIALIYQLRDAAHAHTFDSLHLPQKFVDARKPIVWFHIYRGKECAAEKYAPGKPPCGPSYHAAGDYTLGSYANPLWDNGILLHNTNEKGDGPETPLWNPNAK